jgi:hypothetical protein
MVSYCLQQEYCYQYMKINGKYPLPNVMDRVTLINEINMLRRVSAQQG